MYGTGACLINLKGDILCAVFLTSFAATETQEEIATTWEQEALTQAEEARADASVRATMSADTAVK